MKMEKRKIKIMALALSLFCSLVASKAHATYVGLQSSLPDAIRSLMEFDYDMADTCREASSRVKNQSHKEGLLKCEEDYEKQIQELERIMKAHKEYYPTKADNTKRLITMLRVKIRGQDNDEGILNSMLINVRDAYTAHERMYNRKDLWDDVTKPIRQGYTDVGRQKEWLMDTLKGFKNTQKPSNEKEVDA